jgi:hypothetical protein
LLVYAERLLGTEKTRQELFTSASAQELPARLRVYELLVDRFTAAAKRTPQDLLVLEHPLLSSLRTRINRAPWRWEL